MDEEPKDSNCSYGNSEIGGEGYFCPGKSDGAIADDARNSGAGTEERGSGRGEEAVKVVCVDAEEPAGEIDDGESPSTASEFHKWSDGREEDHVAEEVNEVLVGKEAQEGGERSDPFRIKHCGVNDLGEEDDGEGHREVCDNEAEGDPWGSAVFAHGVSLAELGRLGFFGERWGGGDFLLGLDECRGLEFGFAGDWWGEAVRCLWQ